MTPLKTFWTQERQHWQELPLATFTWLLIAATVTFCLNPLLPFLAYALQRWACAHWNWRDRWASLRALATPGIVFVACLVVFFLLNRAQFWIIPALIGHLQAIWQAHLPGAFSLAPFDLQSVFARLVLLLPLAPSLALLSEALDPRTQTRLARVLIPADLVEPPAPTSPPRKPAPTEPVSTTETPKPPQKTARKPRTQPANQVEQMTIESVLAPAQRTETSATAKPSQPLSKDTDWDNVLE